MGNHRIWRAQAKKMRRKKLRQKVAQERDKILQEEQQQKENSPSYQVWLSEQRALELFAEEEEARLQAQQHAAWMAEEERALRAWRERQERLASARAERAKQELRIKEEWEEEQRKAAAAKKEQERIANEKQLKQEELLRKIEDFINKGVDMPPEVNVASVTNPDRQPCPFFTKTGACRFGDRCSRNHTRPAVSRVLLVPNFYDHIGLRQMNSDEPEAADDWLEYEDSETYQHFLDFYEDVLPEWERVGKISQFKVCCNFEPHLRGNVYIEYESAQDAVQAYKLFHGRFYGGKQINVDFVTIDSWKAAICGQFHKHCCPKGRACNFLHVFRNPGNAFYAADRDQQEWRRKKHHKRPSSSHHDYRRSWSRSPERESNRRRDWRWSASPSPPLEEHNRAPQNGDHNECEAEILDSKRSRKRTSSHKDGKRRGGSSDRSEVTKRHRSSRDHRDHSKPKRWRANIDGEAVKKSVERCSSPSSKEPLFEDIPQPVQVQTDYEESLTNEGRDTSLTRHTDSKFKEKERQDLILSKSITESVEEKLSEQNTRSKNRRSKKKKKDSHRKEKKRKRKLRDSSDSLSSDTHD